MSKSKTHSLDYKPRLDRECYNMLMNNNKFSKYNKTIDNLRCSVYKSIYNSQNISLARLGFDTIPDTRKTW